MDRVTIARIEKGKRKARIDELMALAACLDVAPLFLLAPAQLEAEVQLTPRHVIESFELLAWARGDRPLKSTNATTYRYMAPGSWVTWKPDEPDTIKHGSGFTSKEAQDFVSDMTMHDRKKERSDAE